MGLTVQGSGFEVKGAGTEAGSYSRLIDFVYHSTLSLREIKRERTLSSSFEKSLGSFVQWYRGGLAFEAHRLMYHSA